MVYKFFYACIKHERKDEVIKSLDKYINDDTRYLISMEIANGTHLDTNGEHFHFAISDFEDKYDSYRKTVLVKQFDLRGQARGGKSKQYGTIKPNDVRSETKFLAYMCKDYDISSNQNIIHKNIDKENLLKYIDLGYPKESLDDKIMRYIDDNIDHKFELISEMNTQTFKGIVYNNDIICEKIIDFYIQKNR